jgi:N-acyl-L-homoserine lactone synthetase
MIHWELHAPPGFDVPDWLVEISRFRGKILYDGGRRPEFRRWDGKFTDPDPHDLHAYHLVVRSGGRIVGCLRMFRLTRNMLSLTERHLRRERFEAMLRDLGTCRDDAIEAGRWVVDPDHRTESLGILLAKGAIAAARAFGFRFAICSVGTRGKQDLMLARLGLSPVPNVPLLPDPSFDDELRVMYLVPDRLPRPLSNSIDLISAELGLAQATR